MFRPTSAVRVCVVSMLLGGELLWAQSAGNGPPAERGAVHDRPKVAIVQYESGRVLVAREVNGELLVVEPEGSTAAILDRYLIHRPAVTRSAGNQQVAPPANGFLPDEGPMFFSPDWYRNYVINTNPPNPPTPAGRAVERFKQNAAELRQQVKARRQEQGAAGVTNRAGRVYPSTAADQEQVDRLSRVESESGDSPYVSFYSLGGGLEYYRQQEVAARAELSLLTYDVLLEEGLALFHNRQYAQAARSFIAATQKDQGDAGSRLHAAQCLTATGMYPQALAHVRRACELAPQLLYRPLNHRANYAFPQDFDLHVAALAAHVSAHPDDDDAVMLLAFQQFFSDRPNDAAPAMNRVRELSTRDGFAAKLWKAARPMLGGGQ